MTRTDPSSSAASVERRTSLGSVRGELRRGVEVYYALPYGELAERFAAPAPAEGWTGVRDATRHGPQCPQPVGQESFDFPGLERGGFDENCLTLNVYAPTGPGPHPVIVWIHGGGFTVGSANQFDACALASSSECVVVTINYRLGLLGWLDLSEVDSRFASSADNWLADQVAALQWVQERVGDFAGDPGCVTIAGQSAGAASVIALYSAFADRGLFHRAVACSPPAFSTDPRPDLLGAIATARRTTRAAVADWVRQCPVEDLLALSERPKLAIRMTSSGPLYSRAAVDSITRSGSTPPPLLTGFASHESDFFFGLVPPTGRVREVLMGWGYDLMRRRVAAAVVGPSRPGRAYAMRLRRHYGARGLAFAEHLIDDLFRRGSIDPAIAASRAGGSAYLYEIDLPCTLSGHELRSPHMVDLPLTFDVFSDPDAWNGWRLIDTPEAPSIARRWVAMLGRFARSGNPGTHLGEWPEYDEEGRSSILITPDAVEICHDRDRAARECLWSVSPSPSFQAEIGRS